MSEQIDQTDEIDEPINKTHAAAAPDRRYVYLAGPVEIDDTWRMKASQALNKMGFEALNPMRGEVLKAVGKSIITDAADSLVVGRDVHDLVRVDRSSGLCIMNFNTTKEGRDPGATMAELGICKIMGIPIIAIVGKRTKAALKNNPWVRNIPIATVTCLRDALLLVEDYFV